MLTSTNIPSIGLSRTFNTCKTQRPEHRSAGTFGCSCAQIRAKWAHLLTLSSFKDSLPTRLSSRSLSWAWWICEPSSKTTYHLKLFTRKRMKCSTSCLICWKRQKSPKSLSLIRSFTSSHPTPKQTRPRHSLGSNSLASSSMELKFAQSTTSRNTGSSRTSLDLRLTQRAQNLSCLKHSLETTSRYLPRNAEQVALQAYQTLR